MKGGSSHHDGEGENKKLLVGLGNPGRKYVKTRHNLGFMVLDLLASELDVSLSKKKFQAHYGVVKWEGVSLIIAKPQTYMNLSGRAVRDLVGYFHLAPSSLMVVCDDLNLEPGKLRFRRRGSAGGHKGLQSIIQELNTSEFARLKIGIGTSQARDQSNFVLSNFTAEEPMEQALLDSVEALKIWLEKGLTFSMNHYN